MTEFVPRDMTGTLVAERYRVERLIGQGGMGSVWLGRHISLRQLVAIKFIHPALADSADALRRFDVEAKAAARIKSRHAVLVFDHGTISDSQPYIVMEYLEGEPLEQAIRRRNTLPLSEVSAIVTQAVRALQVAHDAGIIHRDLKPDNIFLAKDREAGPLGYTVKVVDFGIAKMLQEDAGSGAGITQAGTVLGTPHYMSPEALTSSAPIGPKSDVWSLGASAYAALVGCVPFEGDAIGDVVLKVCAAPLPVPSQLKPGLPPAFDAWFQKACCRDLAQRFASVREAAEALASLEAWNQKQKEHAAYELRRSAVDLDEIELPRPPSRGAWLAGVLAGVAITIGALGYYVLQRTREANRVVSSTAASAAAIVEAENARKLREAEEHFWAGVADGAVDGGTDARESTTPTEAKNARERAKPAQ